MAIARELTVPASAAGLAAGGVGTSRQRSVARCRHHRQIGRMDVPVIGLVKHEHFADRHQIALAHRLPAPGVCSKHHRGDDCHRKPYRQDSQHSQNDSADRHSAPVMSANHGDKARDNGYQRTNHADHGKYKHHSQAVRLRPNSIAQRHAPDADVPVRSSPVGQPRRWRRIECGPGVCDHRRRICGTLLRHSTPLPFVPGHASLTKSGRPDGFRFVTVPAILQGVAIMLLTPPIRNRGRRWHPCDERARRMGRGLGARRPRKICRFSELASMS